jgi:putative MATE family efflux protein
MTASSRAADNIFLSGSLALLFARTAMPLIFIMGMNGLLTVIDAYFLGTFVGADALTAVTLMFPVYMLMVALSTLVAGGMASVLARYLGAGDQNAAVETFVGAHALAFIVCVTLIALFVAGGEPMIDRIANHSRALAEMGHAYISILIYASPLAFFLSVQGDAMRCEGRVGLMAVVSLGTSLANIVFNYVLIVVMQQGVAGSAVGTVLAQALALAFVIGFRIRSRTMLNIRVLSLAGWNARWRQFLALGAPQSLSFLGISLGSAAIITAVQIWGAEDYAATVAAYGVITRIMTFAFLPLLGLNMAMQTITGNNFGAALWRRSDASLRFGALTALGYCVAVELFLLSTRKVIGHAFVDDPAPVAQIARILPIVIVMYFLAGPLLILSGYFQAIGDAGRAALLSLSRTYLFAIPLTFALPFVFGEHGIWIAGPVAETLVLMVAMAILVHGKTTRGLRLGVFRHPA